jgi:hypothetical protein
MGKGCVDALRATKAVARAVLNQPWNTTLCILLAALLFAPAVVASADETVDILGFPCDPNAGWLYRIPTFALGILIIGGAFILLSILSAVMNSLSRAFKTDISSVDVGGGLGEHIFGWLFFGVGAVVCAVIFGFSSSCSQATRKMDSLWCFLDSRELNSYIAGPCSLRKGVEPPFSMGNTDDATPSDAALTIVVDRSAAEQITKSQALSFLRQIGGFPKKARGHIWCSYESSFVEPVGGGQRVAYRDLSLSSRPGPTDMTTALTLEHAGATHCTVAIWADHYVAGIWEMALGAVQSLVAMGADCGGQITGSWTRHYRIECVRALRN